MSGSFPGGDPRFGEVAPSGGVQPAGQSRFGSPTQALSPGFTTGPTAAPDAGGFVRASAPAPTAARPRLGTPKWLWPAVLGVVLVLVLGFAAVWHQESQRTKADQAMFKRTTLVMPDSIGGLAQGAGPGVASAQQRLGLALSKSLVIGGVSASYVDTDGNSTVLFAAGKHVSKAGELNSTAEDTAKNFGTGIAAGGDAAPITLTDQPAGPLGGVLRCGPTTVSGVPATFCVAVDQGAIVEVVVATTDQASAADTSRAVRQAVVVRSA